MPRDRRAVAVADVLIAAPGVLLPDPLAPGALSQALGDERLAMARNWSTWEGSCSFLLPDPERVARFDAPEFALALASIETHYFIHRGFFDTENQLLDGIGAVRGIPAVIVQGRYDMVCPPATAWELKRRWPEVELEILPSAGHSAYESATIDALVRTTDRFLYNATS